MNVLSTFFLAKAAPGTQLNGLARGLACFILILGWNIGNPVLAVPLGEGGTAALHRPMSRPADKASFADGVTAPGLLAQSEGSSYVSGSIPQSGLMMKAFAGKIIISVVCGDRHSLALASDGTVYAWGQNTEGQLGDGTTTSRTTPVLVTGLSSVTALAAGNRHSLALKSDGTVWTWGENIWGQLGDGTTTNRPTPMAVSGLSQVTALVAGYAHSLALKSDGTVWAWGLNVPGQLGDGTTTNRPTPVAVSGLSGMTAMAAGGNQSLALKSDGTVWAWGENYMGQLGDGTTTNRPTPVAVSGLSQVTALALGLNQSLALKSDGTVYAWGYNRYGQLGDGTTTNSSTPVAVSGLSGVKALDTGGYHSLALKSDGTVWGWGYNALGQLGYDTPTDRPTPVAVSGLSQVTVLDAGFLHSLALKSDGTVYAWGHNGEGQLGDGTTTNRTTPVLVLFPACTNPVVGFTAAPVCLATPTSLVDASTDVASDATYAWDVDSDGIIDYTTKGNVSHTYATAGTYTVKLTITQGDCQASASQSVVVNALPTVSISPASTTLNSGQSVSLTANGASTYGWSTGATTNPITFPALVGTTPYSVTGTDGKGCSNTATAQVTGVALPALTLRAPASLCVKSTGSTKTLLTLPLTMTLTGGIAPYTYSWAYKTPTSAYKPIASSGTSIGKVSFTPVANSPWLTLSGEKGNLNGLQGYVIRLTVTDQNGNTATATTLLDGSCMLSGGRQGVEEASFQVRLYPNPVVDVLQLEVNGLSQPAQVRLYDIQGRTKGHWSLVPQAGQGTLRADVSALGEGLYIVEVQTSDGVIHRQRVLKQR